MANTICTVVPASGFQIRKVRSGTGQPDVLALICKQPCTPPAISVMFWSLYSPRECLALYCLRIKSLTQLYMKFYSTINWKKGKQCHAGLSQTLTGGATWVMHEDTLLKLEWSPFRVAGDGDSRHLILGQGLESWGLLTLREPKSTGGSSLASGQTHPHASGFWKPSFPPI